MKKEIDIMTGAEIENAMGLSLADLFVLCHDSQDLLKAVISIAIKNGIAQGRYQACLNYNTAFRAEESLN